MVPQNIAERPLNIINILNNLQSFIKQGHRMQNINKKRDQSIYFGAEIRQIEEKLLRLKVKKKIDF